MKLYTVESSSIEDISTRSETINALKSLLIKPTPLDEQSHVHHDDFKLKNPNSSARKNSDLEALKNLLLKPQNNVVVNSKPNCDEIDALKKMLLRSNDTSPMKCKADEVKGIAALKKILLLRPDTIPPEMKMTPKTNIPEGDKESRPQAKKVKKNSPSRRQSPVTAQVTERISPIPSPASQLPLTPNRRYRSSSNSSSDLCTENDRSSFYAGSSFMNSPAPEVIPLPDFDEMRPFDFESNSCEAKSVDPVSFKTESLRRLLKL